MSVSLIFLGGRFLLAVPFVMSGVDRRQGREATSGEPVWAAIGVVAVAGVVLGVWGDVAALVLAVHVLGSVVIGGRARGSESVLTSIGLLGAALVVFAVYAGVGDALDFTITDPIVNLDLR